MNTPAKAIPGVPRPGPAELRDLAALNHFSIADGELASYQALFEQILDNYDRLQTMAAPTLRAGTPGAPRAGKRDAGDRPDASANFCNAFVRKCLVEGSGAGPLAGMRVGLKDSVCVAGVPLTAGSAVIDHVPGTDASIVSRMLDAGANIVAILNMDNLAFSGAGDTSAYGPTFNPHDATRLAGGSSGGSAAALLSGEIDLSIGCDQAGSIRIPASWCGVVGLKPTFSLVPYSGILGYDLSFDHVGPMARTVHDVARFLDVIAGKDGLDPRQTLVPRQNYLSALARKDLQGVRIGVLCEGFGTAGSESDVDETVKRAIERMASLGAQVREVSIPEHNAAGPIVWGVFAEGVTATFQAGGQGHHWSGRYDPDLATAFGSGVKLRAAEMPLQCKFNLMLGSYMDRGWHGSFYAKAQNLRAGLRAAYDAALADNDLLVMPTTPMKAHRHDPSLDPQQLVLAGWNMVANTAPFNMTGHPALSVPCGMSQGLPVGMMLTGRHFDDATLLSVAHVFERSLLA